MAFLNCNSIFGIEKSSSTSLLTVQQQNWSVLHDTDRVMIFHQLGGLHPVRVTLKQTTGRRQTDKDSNNFTMNLGLVYMVQKLLCNRRKLVFSSGIAVISRVRKDRRAVQAHL